jgi:hypothetical protein
MVTMRDRMKDWLRVEGVTDDGDVGRHVGAVEGVEDGNRAS